MDAVELGAVLTAESLTGVFLGFHTCPGHCLWLYLDSARALTFRPFPCRRPRLSLCQLELVSQGTVHCLQ